MAVGEGDKTNTMPPRETGITISATKLKKSLDDPTWLRDPANIHTRSGIAEER
jgi:hypothetical protein